MASPAMVAATTHRRSFAFFTLAFSSCSHPPLPPLKARQPFPLSVLQFSSVPSLRFAACIASRRPVATCLKGSQGFGLPNKDEPSVENSVVDESSPYFEEVTFDTKLPRRSLLVQFTCNSCGERTQRLINRVAYERGTVFVQCAGCHVHHKLIDNLNLVVEYDLRNDVDTFEHTGQNGDLP